MTEIDFYINASDRIQTAIQLCMQAYQQGRSVRILTADEPSTVAIDSSLWKVPATGFFPHCQLGHRLADETPIVVDHRREHPGVAQVLISLHDEPAAFFSRFERLCEIVSTDDVDRASARERYRFYRDRGYPLRTHDLSGGTV